ncbi:two pore domain potassium channel family protein [Candidatus Woesearchaeota archaeon]|nr:two pore domain potassium channel family protein [Candidatus Woesearchaeota archaeon]
MSESKKLAILYLYCFCFYNFYFYTTFKYNLIFMIFMKKEELQKLEEEEHRKFHRRMIYIVIVILMFLFGGATFYYYAEQWRYLDAVYFSAYTMTTVGYGDIVPKTDLGKIFTIFYVFAGVGIALYGLTVISSHFVEVNW